MRRTIVSVLVFLAASASMWAQGTYTQIDYPGAVQTQVNGIDNAHDVVGIYYDGFTEHGFLLSGGLFTSLDVPGASYTQAWGINDLGQIVGYSNLGSFLYDIATQTFSQFRFPGGSTFAQAINNSGTIIGGVDGKQQQGPTSGFQLNGTKYTKVAFPKPGIPNTYLFNINNAGATIAQVWTAHQTKSFLYAQRKFTRLVVPGVSGVVAYGLNDEGAISGTYNNTPTSVAGFVYQDENFQEVLFPESHGTWAFAINNAGEAVGLFLDSNNVPHGFLWTSPADLAGK